MTQMETLGRAFKTLWWAGIILHNHLRYTAEINIKIILLEKTRAKDWHREIKFARTSVYECLSDFANRLGDCLFAVKRGVITEEGMPLCFESRATSRHSDKDQTLLLSYLENKSSKEKKWWKWLGPGKFQNKLEINWGERTWNCLLGWKRLDGNTFGNRVGLLFSPADEIEYYFCDTNEHEVVWMFSL